MIKNIGIDRVVDNIIVELGGLSKVFLVGDFAKGKDGSILDLIFVGENINSNYLLKLIQKSEKLIERKIRYVVFGEDDMVRFLQKKDITEYLLLWENS